MASTGYDRGGRGGGGGVNNNNNLQPVNEDDVSEDDDMENEPPTYQPAAANNNTYQQQQNMSRNNTNNRSNSSIPGRINNQFEPSSSAAQRSNQHAPSGSQPNRNLSSGGTSEASIDSTLKGNMLRNNRERDDNGIYRGRPQNQMHYPYSYDFVRTQPTQKLSRNFIEDHAVELTHIPFYWQVNQNASPYFGLKLKMCQLQRIIYDFEFGSPTGQTRIPNLPSLVERPDKCLKVDFSLNDLLELSYDALQPFPNVRHLDASLNRIENYQGIELCQDLVYVNLSHNFIRNIAHIAQLRSLSELNLSMNDIREISMMPALSNLTILHLNNNRLTSLDGIQSLPRLNELHVQKNKLSEIQPLATSFTLRVLNASDNSIFSLHDTLVVLQALTNVQYLYLHDNPIQTERGYANAVKQLTTAQVLDNVPLRPESLSYDPNQGMLPVLNNKQYDSLGGIRHATEHVFQQQIENHKRKTMNYINQLQRRIRELQEDYVGYENRLKRDLGDVLKHYDAFQYEVAENPRQDAILTPGEKPWAGMSLNNRRKMDRRRNGDTMDKNLFTRRHQIDDRKKLRDPSEILHLAAKDLQLESGRTNRSNRFLPRDDSPPRGGGGAKRGPPNATREQFMDF